MNNYEFKMMNNLAPPIMNNMFPRVYNLVERHFQEYATERKKTIKNGLETVSYCRPQLWALVPETIKNSSLLIEFK